MAQRTTEASVQPGKPVIGAGGFGENVSKDLAELFGLVGSLGALNIPNGSFEISTDGITPNSCVVSLYPGGNSGLVTDVPMHGQRGYKFIHPGGADNGGGTVTFEYFPVDALVTQAIQGMYYASAAGMKLEVILLWYDKDKVALGGTPSTSLYSSTANPTAATKTVWQFTPPAGARFMRLKLVGGNSDTNVAGTAYFDGFSIVPVSVQSTLKTVRSGISRAGAPANLVLPGGQYGFYPQIYTGSINDSYEARFFVTVEAAQQTEATYIYMGGTSTLGGTIYANQRYVTSSAKEYWLFILVNNMGKVISAYEAPDHPCYGNGDDPDLLPHPFTDNITGGLEVVTVALQDIYTLQEEAKKNGRKTLVELHEGGWMVDMSRTEPWVPRDVDGKRIMNIQHPSFTHRRLIKKQ